MKKLTCHCGAIEARVSISDRLETFLDAIAQFVKEKELSCLSLKMKISKL